MGHTVRPFCIKIRRMILNEFSFIRASSTDKLRVFSKESGAKILYADLCKVHSELQAL